MLETKRGRGGEKKMRPAVVRRPPPDRVTFRGSLVLAVFRGSVHPRPRSRFRNVNEGYLACYKLHCSHVFERSTCIQWYSSFGLSFSHHSRSQCLLYHRCVNRESYIFLKKSLSLVIIIYLQNDNLLYRFFVSGKGFSLFYNLFGNFIWNLRNVKLLIICLIY